MLFMNFYCYVNYGTELGEKPKFFFYNLVVESFALRRCFYSLNAYF